MVSESGCLGWLQKRTNLEKTLLSLSSILLLTLLLMILIGITYHGKNAESSSAGETQCWSRECIQTAGEVMRSMRPEADPCEDFYDYACGRYGRGPGQTVSVDRRSTDSVYFALKRLMESKQKLDVEGLEDVRNFYDNCVKFGSYRQDVKETGAALLELMSELGTGTWPIVDPLYDTSGFSRERALASLVLLDVPVAFRMEVAPDELLAGSYLIKISPGGPRESGRTPSDIRGDVHLRSSVLTSFLLLGASAAITSDVSDILSVDSSFAAIEQDKNTTCDVVVLSPQEVTSELNRLMPETNWTVILGEIRKTVGLVRPFAVELHCKQKIRDYIVHLNDLTVRSETNYLGWRFFSKFVEHVIPTFEKSRFGTDEVVPRWRECLQLMEKFSAPVLADLLTKQTVGKEVQSEVERMSNASLGAVRRLVSRTRWLTDAQRSRLQEKVARMRMSYPFRKATPAGEEAKLDVPRVDVSNFTSVVIRRQRQWVIQRFRKLSDPASEAFAESRTLLLTARKDSPQTDYTVSIYFDKIISPYVQQPELKWMNLGGFGIFVAREISKVLISFNAGTGHEESSVLWNLWSRSRNLTACLIAQLPSHSGTDKEVFGADEKLLKNVFLDRSAIEIALEAAKPMSILSESLPALEPKGEKLFFLSYAQTLCEADMHPPNSRHIPVTDRLRTALSNSESFGGAFGCPSPPVGRCRIWT